MRARDVKNLRFSPPVTQALGFKERFRRNTNATTAYPYNLSTCCWRYASSTCRWRHDCHISSWICCWNISNTVAIGGLLTAASTALGAGALYLSAAAGSIIGSAGIFGTTVGASGVTAALMSVGIISSTPIWVPLALGGAAADGAAGLGYGGYRLFKVRQKIRNTAEGEEAQFTDTEAKIVEKIIKRLGKKENPDDEV